MKNFKQLYLKRFMAIIIALILVVSTTQSAQAVTKYENTVKAETLKKLGLITNKIAADELGKNLTREEGIYLVLSMFDLVEDANAMSNTEVNKILEIYPDKDSISKSRKKCVAYAIKEHLSVGSVLGAWEPKGKVDARTFAGWILDRLGYGVKVYTAVNQLKDEAGASLPYAYTLKNDNIISKDIAYGIMFGAMTARFADNSGTVMEALVNSGVVKKKAAQQAGLYSPNPITEGISSILESKATIDITRICVNAGLYFDWTDTDGTIYKDYSYGNSDINKYDLYIPANTTKKEDVGVVLFVHGGSWNAGVKEDEDNMCKRVAKAGYISATLNYSLADGKTENYSISKVLDEIQACVGAIKAELSKRGYHVTKLAMGGTSAGGHLSSLYAYSRADVSPIPVVLEIDKVGPADMHLDTWLNDTYAKVISDEGAVTGVVSAMVNKPITIEEMKNGKAEDLINSVSPVHFINSKSCATLMGYGAIDQIVAQKHHEKLEAALKNAGVDYKFILYPNSDHMLAGDKDKMDDFNSTMLTYLKKYFGY